ncbi:hypothetical protein TrLO_g7857 [Triparma laevis f. longispina]|uniref:Sm domain-containing protein n=1 Tax=Triparma laevis f. longispina TaxID=1714387 RepID=A0A9W7A048_9STRA|nr:hypothetical protein TrLO_g7857 [Triparma laevis f. longispina]
MNVPFGFIPGFLPGASSLLESLDTPILIILRDSSHLHGTLRSYDQFSNLVVSECVRRVYIISKGVYKEEKRGLEVVRGDTIIMLGEYDENAGGRGGGLRKVEEEEFKEIEGGLKEGEEKVMVWDFDQDLNA